ncbi:MAG TPA: hypothetical protein VL043_04555 [Protaetiibacter sp.]|nr:hypothetical protein [Protaetiibacter sp.]
MGFWSNLFGGGAAAAASTLPASPWSTSDLEQITVAGLFGDAQEFSVITEAIARRVPGLKRALGVHAGLVARTPFREWEFETLVDPQPAWLYRTASEVSPYIRAMGVTSDLFWYGWALLGGERGSETPIADAVHVPMGMWSVDRQTGRITIDERIPARYREVPIAIPLGMPGVLTDGIDTIRAARDLEFAWMDRIANPIAQTELHLTEDIQLSKKDKRKLAEEYNAGRVLKGGATSVTPHNVEVKLHGEVAVNLFESGRNAIRLDLANHAYVPASIIEGAKNGSAGEINYSNETGKRNELYDYGTALFVNAIEARLSMDDVCQPGHSIRADLTGTMTVPTPLMSPARED